MPDPRCGLYEAAATCRRWSPRCWAKLDTAQQIWWENHTSEPKFQLHTTVWHAIVPGFIRAIPLIWPVGQSSKCFAAGLS